MNNFKTVLSALVLWTAFVCISADNTGYVRQDAEVLKRAFTRDCDTGYSLKCLKLDAVAFIEKMAETEEYTLLPGVTVIKENSANESKTAEIVAGTILQHSDTIQLFRIMLQ